MSQPPVPGHHREELRSPASAPKTTAPVVHSFTSSATLPPDPHPRLRRLLHIPDGMMNTGIHVYGTSETMWTLINPDTRTRPEITGRPRPHHRPRGPGTRVRRPTGPASCG